MFNVITWYQDFFLSRQQCASVLSFPASHSSKPSAVRGQDGYRTFLMLNSSTWCKVHFLNPSRGCVTYIHTDKMKRKVSKHVSAHISCDSNSWTNEKLTTLRTLWQSTCGCTRAWMCCGSLVWRATGATSPSCCPPPSRWQRSLRRRPVRGLWWLSHAPGKCGAAASGGCRTRTRIPFCLRWSAAAASGRTAAQSLHSHGRGTLRGGGREANE